MTVAIISFISLAVSVFLGVREIRRRQGSPIDFDGAASPNAEAAETGEAAARPEAPHEEPEFAGILETASLTSRSGIGWGITFCLMQLFMGILGVIGLAPDDFVSPLVLNIILAICAHLSFARDLTRARLARYLRHEAARKRESLTFAPACDTCDKYDTCSNRIPREKDLTRTARLCRMVRRQAHRLAAFLHRPEVARTIILMLAGLFAMLGLEIPSNHDLTWTYPLCMMLEWSLITAVMVGLFHLFQRRAGAPAFFAFAMWILGMAEYFVITFKSMPIQPADLSALGTAAAVSGNFTYMFSAFGLIGMGMLAISMWLCTLAAEFRPDKPLRTRRMLAVNLLIGVLCLGGVTAHVTLIDYYNTLNITVYTWRPLESYYRQGFLPTFISSAQTIKPPVPEDYTVADAKKLEGELADEYDADLGQQEGRLAAEQQFDEEKPTVIAIMNETFADLSIYQNMHADYEGPKFFKSLPDTLSRGTLYVSAYGGGTCNTEFEFLTGNSMSFLGSGVYPYTIYDLSGAQNLARQFGELGYDTTAIHPNHGTNWNRENVYTDLGFEQFLTIQDFQNADKLRGMVSDKATYDKIMQMLKDNKNPQFIFDVTMQNHSGYKTGLLPLDKQRQYLIDGESNPEVDEYLSLIEESDRALEEFIGRLRKLDRKVVVVFFGDHQPFFPDKFNDAWFTDEDKAEHAMRLWTTDYFVWANYDVAGNSQTSEADHLSTNFLGTETLNMIGAPLSDYQKAQLVVRQDLPAINTTGFLDIHGNKFLSTTELGDVDDPVLRATLDRALTARDKFDTVQYLELFGDGKDVYTKKKQAAANETDPNLAPGTTQIK